MPWLGSERAGGRGWVGSPLARGWGQNCNDGTEKGLGVEWPTVQVHTPWKVVVFSFAGKNAGGFW